MNVFCSTHQQNPTEFAAISIKGPILVQFNTTRSIFPDASRRKNYRGFKLSYALSECGGELPLSDGERSKMAAVITSPGKMLLYLFSFVLQF